MSAPGLRKARPWQGTRPGSATPLADPPADHTLVVFDVPSDKARRKVGELCKDYGLRRFQWSAFEGPMSRTRREELYERVRRLLASAEGGGKLLVVAVAERELAGALRTVERGTPTSGAS